VSELERAHFEVPNLAICRPCAYGQEKVWQGHWEIVECSAIYGKGHSVVLSESSDKRKPGGQHNICSALPSGKKKTETPVSRFERQWSRTFLPLHAHNGREIRLDAVTNTHNEEGGVGFYLPLVVRLRGITPMRDIDHPITGI
jgi:hypothetical protein